MILSMAGVSDCVIAYVSELTNSQCYACDPNGGLVRATGWLRLPTRYQRIGTFQEGTSEKSSTLASGRWAIAAAVVVVGDGAQPKHGLR
jgi:hypothetical protein